MVSGSLGCSIRPLNGTDNAECLGLRHHPSERPVSLVGDLISQTYLIRNASFLSLRAFISSRIQRGRAPRPAQVSFGSFLLRYFGGTFRPFRADLWPRGRPRRAPLPTSVPISDESCLRRSDALSFKTTAIPSRSSTSAPSDILARFFGRAIACS